MTGLSTLTVELDDVSNGGTWPYNISSRVSIRDGWDFARGRNDEQDAIEVAIAHLSLNNNDGALTLGSASFGGLNIDRRLRITETYSATVYRRCVGYVQNWPTEWPSPHGNIARARIIVADRQSRLNRRKLRSMSEQEILADSPYAYYTLGEAAGSLSAGDTSGNGRLPLTFGGGSAPVFGGVGPNAWDGLTCVTETATTGAEVAGLVLVTTGTSLTIRCAIKLPSVSTVALAFTDDASLADGGTFNINITCLAGNTILLQNAGSSRGLIAGLIAGTWHDVLVTIVAGTYTLYVDGVAAAPVAGTAIPPATAIYRQSKTPTADTSLADLATYNTALSAARAAAHASAILTGASADRADQRMVRLAAFANIPVGEQNYETGQQPSIAAGTTSGDSVQAAMVDVAQAEGGVAFIAGDGRHTLHNKSHRPLKATGTVALALTGADLDAKNPPKFAGDKNYLVNSATGSRRGGAAQRSVNQASVNKYEEYPADRSNALLPTDELMLNQLTWLTTMYAEVGHRISELTIDLLTLDTPAKVQAALALELGDRVTVASLPAQSPIATADLIVEGIKESQKTDSWTLTLNTVPSSVYQAWILGDATFSQLGVTTRLYF